MSHEHGHRREDGGGDHGGHDHGGHDHGGHGGTEAACPCCGGAHRHPTYFREMLAEYERTPDYKEYLKYVESCRPHDKPQRPQPECETDCSARTTTGLYIRKATSAMTTEDWTRFQDAWLAICSSGFLGQQVLFHRGPHRMHGGGVAGRRFLPWHRVYLLRLEEELHRADPCAILPYWDWDPDTAFPAGIRNFLPAVVMPDGTTFQPTRGSWSSAGAAGPTGLPPAGTEAFVLAAGDYVLHLARNQSSHDTVHVRVGGSMSSIANAPADPIFWMHHANADRMWHDWQQANPGAGTGLAGADAVMDPWSETDTAVLDIAALGYTYV